MFTTPALAHAVGVSLFYIMCAMDFWRELAIEAERGLGRDVWRAVKHKHMFPVNRFAGGVAEAYRQVLAPVLWQDLVFAPLAMLVHAAAFGGVELVPWGGAGTAAMEAALEGIAGPTVAASAASGCELVWRAVAVGLVHEAWVYAAHRAMHAPGVYEAVHRFHHRTPQVSLSANAAHPADGFLVGPPVLTTVCAMMGMPAWFVVAASCFGYALNCRVHAGWLEDDGAGGPTMHHQIHHWHVNSAYGFQEWSDRIAGTIMSRPGKFAPPGTEARTKADTAS